MGFAFSTLSIVSMGGQGNSFFVALGECCVFVCLCVCVFVCLCVFVCVCLFVLSLSLFLFVFLVVSFVSVNDLLASRRLCHTTPL